jgi:hypothetical protein
MSETVGPPLLVKYLSILFVIWLLLWLVALPLLPRAYYTTPFFLLGLTPVAGWFLIHPRRIRWFILVLFGLNETSN